MDYNVCVLRAPGTNCDTETAWSINNLGMGVEVVHAKRFLEGRANLSKYDGLIIPGGFSFGDHVRAGALLGKILKERFGTALWEFSDEEKPILGICNGFQVLVECGLLPGTGMAAALTENLSSKFECRWVHLKTESAKCIFTKGMDPTLSLPVAHGEGRFLTTEEELDRLEKRGQVVLRYTKDDGTPCGERYPANPNGSLRDVAGICNPSGTVLGLMPHPERAFYSITQPGWTRKQTDTFGEGYKIFKNMVDYIKV